MCTQCDYKTLDSMDSGAPGLGSPAGCQAELHKSASSMTGRHDTEGLQGLSAESDTHVPQGEAGRCLYVSKNCSPKGDQADTVTPQHTKLHGMQPCCVKVGVALVVTATGVASTLVLQTNSPSQ